MNEFMDLRGGKWDWEAEFADALGQVLGHAIREGKEETRKALQVFDGLKVKGYTTRLMVKIQSACALLAQQEAVEVPQEVAGVSPRKADQKP